MMIYHDCFETPINIVENEHNIIVVENQNVLYRLLKACYDQVFDYGEEFTLSHNGDIKIFSKNVDFLYDLISFSINDKKNTLKIVKGIHDKALNEEYYEETMNLMAMIENHFDKIAVDLDYAIRVDKPNISEIVKAISPSIIEESTTLVEKLINYVRLTYLFTGKSIYIFNQIKNLLKDDDLKQLYKYFEYEKLVFISFEAQTREKLLNEKYTIIDSDLCIIK